MSIFYKAMLIVAAFLIFICLLYLGFNRWIREPTPKFDYKAWEADQERIERAINLVRERHWSWIKPKLESLAGYVKHIGWEARKVPRERFFDRYTFVESTYIVSYTYETVELLREEMVKGWWWEVVLGANTVRSIKMEEYLKEKALADSIQAYRDSVLGKKFEKYFIKKDSSK